MAADKRKPPARLASLFFFSCPCLCIDTDRIQDWAGGLYIQKESKVRESSQVLMTEFRRGLTLSRQQAGDFRETGMRCQGTTGEDLRGHDFRSGMYIQ